MSSWIPHPGDKGASFTWVLHWCAVGASLCWWPDAPRGHPGEVYLQAQVDMESKGIRVNMIKTRFLPSVVGHDVLKKSGKYPCAVCCSSVGDDSIHCSQCMLWVHKRCSGIAKRLLADWNYAWRRCNGNARHINGRTVTEVDVNRTMLDAEAPFCYLFVICCAPFWAVTMPSLPDVLQPGKSSGNSLAVPITGHLNLAYAVC